MGQLIFTDLTKMKIIIATLTGFVFFASLTNSEEISSPKPSQNQSLSQSLSNISPSTYPDIPLDSIKIYTIPYIQASGIAGPGFGIAVRFKSDKNVIELDSNIASSFYINSSQVSASYLFFPKNNATSGSNNEGFNYGIGLAFGRYLRFDPIKDFHFLAPVLQLGYQGKLLFCALTGNIMNGLVEDAIMSLHPVLKFGLKF